MTLEGSGGTAEVNQKSKRVKSMTFKEFVDMVNQFHDAHPDLDNVPICLVAHDEHILTGETDIGVAHVSNKGDDIEWYVLSRENDYGEENDLGLHVTIGWQTFDEKLKSKYPYL